MDNKHRIRPIFPRISNTNRKRGPSSAHCEGSYFSRYAIHNLKDNQLTLLVYRAETLQKCLRSIKIHFKHLCSLKKLKLRLDNRGRKVNDLDFPIISQTLKRSVYLQSLELDVAAPAWSRITNRGLYYLGEGLKRLSSLKHFDFPFGFNEHINDQGLNYLSQSIKRLTCLERLTLDFGCCKGITEFGVSALSASLKNLLLLKNLKICFSPVGKIAERGFLDFCDPLERLVHLQSFSFNLRGLCTTDAGLKRFGQVLQRLVSLQSLKIILPDEKTTDLGFYELFKGLKRLICLEKLVIEASILAALNNKRFLYLSKALGKLVCLKNLEIKSHNSYNKLNDQGLASLGPALEKLKSLEKFTLGVYCAYQIGDQGLFVLSEGLKNLVLLQEISLSFSVSQEITNEGALNFCKGLSRLGNLRNLGFHTSTCPNLTGNGLYMICQVLKDIPSFEKFTSQQWGMPVVLDGKSKILEALKFPKKYFPGYKRKLEKGNTKNLLKRSFILLSLCVLVIRVLVFWLLNKKLKLK